MFISLSFIRISNIMDYDFLLNRVKFKLNVMLEDGAMNKLSIEKRAMILTMLVEGSIKDFYIP